MTQGIGLSISFTPFQNSSLNNRSNNHWKLPNTQLPPCRRTILKLLPLPVPRLQLTAGFAEGRESNEKHAHFELPSSGEEAANPREVSHVNAKYESYCTRTTRSIKVDAQEEAPRPTDGSFGQAIYLREDRRTIGIDLHFIVPEPLRTMKRSATKYSTFGMIIHSQIWGL